MTYPKNVGIKAMEIYVPNQCLDQTLFEKHQGVSAGKYTVGLGLQRMNFCTDREDVCSLALTAVSSLLRKYNIDPLSIGRLEVGTESPVDKAKSVKSVLTQLFEPAGNTSMEGVDCVNACYGGTNALFNAVNWVESRSWDGRDAIVVASDIAIYDKPSSRPTGGAGCVAMLIGPGAVLALDAIRGTYMTHSYDFYKPRASSEYPLVDGHMSIECYMSALDKCYANLVERLRLPEQEAVLDRFDYMAFHTPNCKLVSKSFGRLLYNDMLRNGNLPEGLRRTSYEESLRDKDLERKLVALSRDEYLRRVEPCIRAPTLCGNMYTASVYCSLISLLSHAQPAVGEKVGVFSYGSGLASTLFSFTVTGDVTDMVDSINLMQRLDERRVTGAEEYEEACALREKAYGAKDFTPKGSVAAMQKGTYYLKEVDGEYRRVYAVV